MKKNLTVCLFTIFLLCNGCATTDKEAAAPPCKPLSAFKTIILAPVKSDSATVEEIKYKPLPKSIALTTDEILKDEIVNSRIFNNVIQSSECVDNAIKINVVIYSLLHNWGSFEVKFGGNIINCQDGESLHIFNDAEDDDESRFLAGHIADNLFESIKDAAYCEN